MATTKASETGAKILNAIRADASENYQATVPLANSSRSISEVEPFILGEAYTANKNEFINALINRIIFPIIETKAYENKFKRLKSGSIPLGTDIQDIYTNPTNPMGYDGKNLSGILKLYDNDTKVVYYRRNRQDVFPLSINREQLRGAFVSWETFDQFIKSLVTAVYSGNEIREFNLFKESIVNGYNNNMFVTRAYTTDTAEALENLIADIRTTADNFTFPGSKYNRWKDLVADELPDATPVVTWSTPERMLVIMRADLVQKISVKVLAAAFNLSEVEFRNNLITVDDFGFDVYDLENRKITGHETSKIGALVCDESAIKVWDNLETAASDHIGSSLTWQFFLHVWQTYGICPFANAKVYIDETAPVIQNMKITDFGSGDNIQSVFFENPTETATLTYEVTPSDYSIKTTPTLSLVNVIKTSGDEDTPETVITDETLPNFVVVKSFDNEAKTITLESGASCTGTKTALLVLELDVDNYKIPITVNVNYTPAG